MEWVLAALLALFEPPLPPAPRAVVIDHGHISALADATQRTGLFAFEEIYCLVGLARPNGTYHVIGIVKPDQKASLHVFGQTAMSTVVSKPCPPGTIGDIHTHPFGSPDPSYIDRNNWQHNRRFTLHLIGFMLGPGRVGFQAWDSTDPDTPRRMDNPWLIVNKHKEATWKP